MANTIALANHKPEDIESHYQAAEMKLGGAKVYENAMGLESDPAEIMA